MLYQLLLLVVAVATFLTQEEMADFYASKRENLDRRANAVERSDAQALEFRHDFLMNPRAQDFAWQTAEKFADCVVRTMPERAMQLLDQDRLDSHAKPIRLANFLRRARGCVAFQVAMDRDFLTAAIAEKLLSPSTLEKNVFPVGDRDTVRNFMWNIYAPNSHTDDPFTMGQFEAECRAGFSPSGAHEFILAPEGSTEERVAMQKWHAATQQCDIFAPEGQLLTTQFRRAYAAKALYHWVFSSQGTGARAWTS